MATLKTGYRNGVQNVQPFGVDSASADIVKNDLLVWGTAGYVQQAAAGEIPMGIAQESVASPSADGGATVMVDISDTAQYVFAPDAGTVTVGLVGKTCDVGGAQTIDIDASADDCIAIVGVDTTNNLVICNILTDLARTGVA